MYDRLIGTCSQEQAVVYATATPDLESGREEQKQVVYLVVTDSLMV